jgi:hypothetical protein
LTKTQPTNEEGQQFVQQQFDVYRKSVPLSDPPGGAQENALWADGFAEHIFKKMVSPKCRASLAAGAKVPPDLGALQVQLAMGARFFLADRGYEFTGPGIEAAAFQDPGAPSLVDIVRGLG